MTNGRHLIGSKMKKCSCCKEVKSLSEFHNDRSKKDGKNCYCKGCIKQKNISINDRPKNLEPKFKKDGTIHRSYYLRKEGYELPYGQRPQRKEWYEKNKERLNANCRQYNADNWEELKVKKVEYLNKIRAEGIAEYGGKCVCCGEETPEFLTIDHINGRQLGEVKHGGRRVTGKKLFLYMKSKKWPKDNYQLLCWNCNCAKGIYGECPHKKGGGQ